MLRRPVFFSACSCVAAVIISYYAGGAAVWSLPVLAALSALLSGKTEWTKRRKKIAVLLILSYIMGAASFFYAEHHFDKQAEDLDGSEFEGIITQRQNRLSQSEEPYIQLTVRSDKGSAIVKCYESCTGADQAQEGCRVLVQGKLEDPSVKRNPGCFDYALYLRSIGVVKTVTAQTIRVYPVGSFRTSPASCLRNRIYNIREGFIRQVGLRTGEETAGIIRAIMFGDKGGLDSDMLEAFQKNGTAHILAVSGLHIGIIYGFILKLWRWRRGWAFFAFNGVFFGFYAAAAGFSPSVTRAVAMVMLHIAAGITGRRYDMSSSAFVIIMAVLMHNPYMLFNSGFQMSFLAVMSIVLVLPYIKRVYTGLFMMSLVVQAGLGPFIIYNFNYLSLIAVVINVPVVAMAGIIVPASLVGMALSAITGADHILWILEPMCQVLQRLNEVTQIDGLTTFQIPSPPAGVIGAYYLMLLFFATEEGRLAIIRAASRARYIMSMLLIVAVMSAGFGAFASDGFRGCEAVFVDVGQGDCTCIKTGGYLAKDRCYLFDGGGSVNYNVGKSILRSYLLKNGIGHVDGAFVTHLHTDHYKGICELAREGMVDRIYVYEANRLKEEKICGDTGLDPDRIEYLAAGDRINLSHKSGLLNTDSVYVDVLHPTRKSDAEYQQLISDETDENILSLLFKVTFSGSSGSSSILITGDMGEEGEAELLEGPSSSLLNSQILKVGHHGSKTSSTSDFLASAAPRIAVIQVGENNNYGHPSPEALERIRDCGAAVYRNDLQGAVGIDIERGAIRKVKTMIHHEKNQ